MIGGMTGLEERLAENLGHGSAGTDRRQADRFPIQSEVRYRIIGLRGASEEGTGKTINISSSGLLFTTERPLTTGKRIEISMDWPARLDNKCRLKLIARGTVTRTEAGAAAATIQQYEFRTAGRPTTTVTPQGLVA